MTTPLPTPDAIRAAFAANDYRTTSVAQIFGVHRVTAGKWARNLGIQTNRDAGRNGGRPSTAPPDEELRAAFATHGSRTAAIAEIYGVDQKTAARWAKRLGIELARTGRRKPPPTDLTERLYECSTISATARHYRVTTATVKRWLEERERSPHHGLSI